MFSFVLANIDGAFSKLFSDLFKKNFAQWAIQNVSKCRHNNAQTKRNTYSSV